MRVRIHAITKPNTKGHHGGGKRHREGIEHDLRVLQQAVEIIDAIGGRRPDLRVTDVEGRLQQKVNRVEDENCGNSRDPIPGHFLHGKPGSHRPHSRPRHRPSMPFHSFKNVALCEAYSSQSVGYSSLKSLSFTPVGIGGASVRTEP